MFTRSPDELPDPDDSSAIAKTLSKIIIDRTNGIIIPLFFIVLKGKRCLKSYLLGKINKPAILFSLMKTFSNKDTIYIGRQVGDEILREIKKAKDSVKIVSPYLSGSYVKELVTLHNQNKKITLITADNITENNKYSDFRSSNLIIKKEVFMPRLDKVRRRGIALFLIFIAISFVALLSSFIVEELFYPALFFMGASFVFMFYFFFMPVNKVEYRPLFRIKVFDSKSGKSAFSTELIHSKIYVIDDKIAFVGSANFTYSGFKTHYETAVKIEDEKAVLDISREVEALYDSKDLRAKDIEEWAGV